MTISRNYFQNLVTFTRDIPNFYKTMSDSEDEVAERQFKICLIGDTQVGKTSIASRYATDNFGKFPSTVGVEFYLKRTVLPGPRHITLKVNTTH